MIISLENYVTKQLKNLCETQKSLTVLAAFSEAEMTVFIRMVDYGNWSNRERLFFIRDFTLAFNKNFPLHRIRFISTEKVVEYDYVFFEKVTDWTTDHQEIIISANVLMRTGASNIKKFEVRTVMHEDIAFSPLDSSNRHEHPAAIIRTVRSESFSYLTGKTFLENSNVGVSLAPLYNTQQEHTDIEFIAA